MILAFFFPVISAISYGTTSVLVRIGIEGRDSSAAAFLTVVVSSLVIFPLVLISGGFGVYIGWVPFFYFVLTGILNNILGRTFSFVSIKGVGASRVTPFFATLPLFSTFFAVLFIGERPTVLQVSGIFLVAIGIYLITAKESLRGKKIYYLMAVIAPLCWGLASLTTKAGLREAPYPVLANFIGLVTGALFYFVLLIITGRINAFKTFSGKSYKFLVTAGVVMAVAQLSLFLGLNVLPVVIVMPIVSIFPLVTLVAARIFLKKVEAVTLKLVLGTVLIVAGVIMTVVLR